MYLYNCFIYFINFNNFPFLILQVNKWTPEEAVEFIKTKRSHVWLRDKQIQSIHTYFENLNSFSENNAGSWYWILQAQFILSIISMDSLLCVDWARFCLRWQNLLHLQFYKCRNVLSCYTWIVFRMFTCILPVMIELCLMLGSELNSL